MDKLIQKRVDEWSNPPFDNETISEIKALAGNEKELIDRFYTTLEFGTGGLRGVLGAGTNRMNIHTVGMATQGLANYIIQKSRTSQGVVISYDSRRFSDIFARATASILAANGIKPFIFDDITPTPLCSYAIRELGAVSGIMITASHNPPEYNGYKCYWDDGGQVVPPDDKAIIAEVNKINSISMIRRVPFDEGVKNGLIITIGENIRSGYISLLEGIVLRPKNPSKIKIVYTPLHGTGYKIMPRVFSHFGFTNFFPVESQSIPDSNFPTVKYPNPEEKDALELAVELAKKTDADILLATDPDADRMGVGIKDGKGGYLLINGNQIGTMLEYYLLSRMNADGKLPKDGRVVKTIVTTELQADIAKSFGCGIDNVLTGFKWIALKMKEYDERKSGTFIFGGEESYGYLPLTFVRDKDAVSACYFFCEMTDWLSTQGRTLLDFLNEIYIRYGLYMEDLTSLTLKGIDGMERIKKIMTRFRENPPKSIGGIDVIRIDDIKTLTRTDCDTNVVKNIEGLPSSDVIQFFLSDESKITMRPSGTEPKIKFYYSAKIAVARDSLEKSKTELSERIDAFKKDIIGKAESV
jgi:phosphoglucomutase